MSHCAVAQVTLIVIRHPGIDIARLCAEFPIFTQVIPRKHTAEGVLALGILKVGIAAVVDGQHRKLAIGVYIPRIKTQAVTLECVVVDLLQNVQVLIRTAAVAFYGVILIDDIHIIVVNIELFVSVDILVIVWR